MQHRPKSPSKGKMRQIPLLYADSDNQGDELDEAKAMYLFCGSADISINIFGLNIERWCKAGPGKQAYQSANKWVDSAKFPGSFMFSEMGCSKENVDPAGPRDWAQLDNFFDNFGAVDGYVAYTTLGNPDFNMLASDSETADLNEDGKNFFSALNKASTTPPTRTSATAITPNCDDATAKLKKIASLPDLEDVSNVKTYDTGETGFSTNCPAPVDTFVQLSV